MGGAPAGKVVDIPEDVDDTGGILNAASFVPANPIHIQTNGVPSKAIIKMLVLTQ